MRPRVEQNIRYYCDIFATDIGDIVRKSIVLLWLLCDYLIIFFPFSRAPLFLCDFFFLVSFWLQIICMNYIQHLFCSLLFIFSSGPNNTFKLSIMTLLFLFVETSQFAFIYLFRLFLIDISVCVVCTYSNQCHQCHILIY